VDEPDCDIVISAIETIEFFSIGADYFYRCRLTDCFNNWPNYE